MSTRSAAIASLIASTACLFPSLGDLSGGADASTDAISDITKSDAPPDGGTGSKYRAAVMAGAPVAYWRFGDKQGGGASDEIGQHPGSIIGAHVTAGIPGAIANDPDTAFQFASNRDTYVDIGDVFSFGGNVPYTFEVWVRAVDDGSYNVLLSKDAHDDAGGGPDLGYDFFLGPDTPTTYASAYRYTGGGVGSTTVANMIPYGQWVYLVTVFDGTNQSMYVNGDLPNAPVVGATMTPVSSHLLIGGEQGNGGYFEGSLDEIAIYDKALSAARIGAHYAAAQ